ncbi:MAG: GAF domain-containing protein [Anaerolineales bacterium]|nr:GAF domain-containing protein [Anaerolineales bacterium]
MGFGAALPLALAVLAVGAALLGLTAVSLRWLRRRRLTALAYRLPALAAVPAAAQGAGVVVAALGGRVEYANERARQLFGLNGEAPRLRQLLHAAQPPDRLLELFAAEGQAEVSLADRPVQVTSLRVALPGEPERFVIVLRDTTGEALARANQDSVQALCVVADINRSITSSLDPAETYDAVVASLPRAFRFSLAELNLWDPAAALLRPVRHSGDQDYPRQLELVGAHYAPDEGYSGWITTRREPLLVANINAYEAVRPKLFGVDFPFEAYLGVPLLIGDDFVGTLELASYHPDAFQVNDLAVLSLIGAQAAQAIRNAQRFAEQQRHAAELSGLAEITRALEASSDPRELYGRLAAEVARFLAVEQVAFMDFQPEASLLIGQPPFHGMPDIVAEVYRLALEPDSLALRLWELAEPWLSNDVPNDPDVDALGLREFAVATGARTTLLAPIGTPGRRMGLVQISNKLDGSPFLTDDVRLLQAFAAQVAAILDNARLVREAQVRAEEADILRGIAAATAATPDLDTALRLAMRQAASLLRFDYGMIALLDEARGELVPHPASVYGGQPDEALAVRLRNDDPLFAASITRTRRPFLSGRALRDRRIAGFYRQLVEHFQVNSAMDVPLVVSDRCIGEMIVVARREHAFTRSDLRLLSTIASQLASAIERARLSAATDQNLQRRVDQLTALTRVSRELNQTLELERILRLVHDEVVHATRADCGTLVLLDQEAAPGSVAMRLGEETLGNMLTTLEAEFVRGEAPRRHVISLPPDSELAAHAGVQSVLIVPILVQGQVVGLVHLHSRRAVGFDESAQEAAQALAAQTAIAVENTRRYAEQIRRADLLRRRADQLGQLFEVSQSVRSDRPLGDNLEAIAFGLQEAVGFNVVLISVLDPKSRRLLAAAASGLPLAAFEALTRVQVLWDEVARVLRDEFRLSQSFFLPGERAASLVRGLENLLAHQSVTEPEVLADWQPQDALLVPLRGSHDEPVGLLTVGGPRDGRRPDRNTVEIIEIFANQAAQAIENARLYAAAERRAGQLLALHRVVEAASAPANRGRLAQIVVTTLLAEMRGPDVAVLALRAASNAAPGAPPRLEIAGAAGTIRPHIALDPLLAGTTPLGDAVTGGGPMLLLQAAETDWGLNPFVVALEAASFVSVPIVSQGAAVGALFVGAHHAANQPSPFEPEDLDVYTILANQLGARLESARLEADIEQRAAQLAALAEVSQTITATLRTVDVLQAVLGPHALRRVLDYDSVTLWLRDGERLRIAAAHGFEDDAERLGLQVDIADSVLFAEMARTQAPIVVPDVWADPRFAAGQLQPTRSWLAAPLASKGRILGVLALDKAEAHYYSQQAASILLAFASQAAVALDNAHLFEESEQRTQLLDERSQRLARLNRVSAQLSGTLYADQIYAITLTEMVGALDVARALALTLDPGGQAQLTAYHPALPGEPAPAGWVLGHVAETLTAVAMEDVVHDALLATEPGAAAALQARGVWSLLVVPLVIAGQMAAAIQLEETRAARRFTPGEIELAQTLANQAAVAVQNARLYAETKARNEELVVLNRVTSTVNSLLDLEAMLRATAREMVPIFAARHCGIALLNAAGTHLTVIADASARPDDPSSAGLAIALAGDPSSVQVIETGQSLIVPRAFENPLTEPIHDLLRERATHCLMIVPLRTRGEVIGTIGLDTDQSDRVFTAPEVSLAETLAGQIAGAVENARFAQELEARVTARTAEVQRERERVEILLQVTTELSSSLDLDRVLTRALQLVTESIHADRGAIYLIDMESDQLTYRAALGRPQPLPPGGQPASFRRSEGLVGWAIQTRQGAVIADLAADRRSEPLPDLGHEQRSALVVPLLANEDSLGAMILFSPQPNTFDEDQLRLVSAAANQVAAAINNAELYRLIRDQAERLGAMLRGQQVEATKSRAILEGIADGVLVAGADGAVILINVACERILGLDRQRVVGHPITELVGIYGAGSQAWTEAIRRWGRNPNSYQPGDFVDQRLTLDNQRVVSVHLAPVIAADEYLGAVSVIRDISREVEVDRLKSEFVTNVSHELRTPMTSIKGYADLLLLGTAGALQPDQARFLEVIKSNADRLSLLVNDLLDISRIEAGRVQLALRPIPIADVIDDVLITLRGRIEDDQKPMTLTARAGPGLPPVWADRARITQIIMNLGDNAFNYSHPGGEIVLCARHDPEAREVIVEVTDSGIGVAPEDQPRLFGRFYRGEDALVLANPGTGLGLAIARQLAEMHGGRLWLARSEVGQGSTFALALPMAETA